MVLRSHAERLLRLATAIPDIGFRDGQWEAIDQLVNRRGRALVVQRTGWGKSMVYFLSAKLFREQGAGPAVIISPLLALMRNQLEHARRLGLNAETMNSANPDDWREIKDSLVRNEVDLLLISPERLANDVFVRDVLLPIAGRIALLVVDEAHCISDWGHDFRPDYRRIVQILRQMPQNVAVLATTATANRRVVADIEAQLGQGLLVLRGPLVRESLKLQVLAMPNAASRLAWLADHVGALPDSGIIYTLTKKDAERVSGWLSGHGIPAAAYYSGAASDRHPDSNAYRELLEQQLLRNELKCVVATSALGMGFDKPDLGFVIHFQAPGSVVHYYQQVGRAGRAIDEAYGLLMSGDEDADINAFFRDTAFPPEDQVNAILAALGNAEDGLSVRSLEREVNLRQSQIEKVLKLLVVEDQSPVLKQGATWYRTANAYRMDRERIDHLTGQREAEWAQMQAYMSSRTCLMEFLAKALDDDTAAPCGRCAVCREVPHFPESVSPELLAEAQRLLRHSETVLEPKKQWATGAFVRYGWPRANIPTALRAEEGRILSRWGEVGTGALVKEGKRAGMFSDELVVAAAEMIRERWPAGAGARWMTCAPSLRHPRLVSDFANRLAQSIGVPFRPVVVKIRETAPQKGMENRDHQCRNLDGAFAIEAGGHDISAPVILVDDVFDSGWTLAVIATLLREAGSGPVFPLALASAKAE